MLSVLAGHRRYAHITTLRCDPVNPPLLGMAKVVSEDAVRRALSKIETEAGRAWLQEQLDYCTRPLLREPHVEHHAVALALPRMRAGRAAGDHALEVHSHTRRRHRATTSGSTVGLPGGKRKPRRALQPIIFGLLQFSLLNLRPSSY